MLPQPGTIFAKVHDVEEDYDPDTGVRMEPAVEIELDVVVGDEVHCLNTYVPPSYDYTQICDAVTVTTRALVQTLGLPEDTPVTITEYRHVPTESGSTCPSP